MSSASPPPPPTPFSSKPANMARNGVTPIPPAAHNHFRVPARVEDPSPCPKAHTSPSVGNVKSPAIPTRGTLSCKGRTSSRSSGRNCTFGVRSQERAGHCASGLVSYRERQRYRTRTGPRARAFRERISPPTRSGYCPRAYPVVVNARRMLRGHMLILNAFAV